MSMTHKAFVFDYARFDADLRPILVRALETGDCTELKEFIRRHLSELTDPYEGEPLTESWESMLEYRDAHQYGDFALTRYYDPSADIGLGADWQSVEELLEKHGITNATILGQALGPANNPFDPGKMGSYFQSASMVKASLEKLDALPAKQAIIDEARSMLVKASDQNKGLYVTF